LFNGFLGPWGGKEIMLIQGMSTLATLNQVVDGKGQLFEPSQVGAVCVDRQDEHAYSFRVGKVR